MPDRLAGPSALPVEVRSSEGLGRSSCQRWRPELETQGDELDPRVQRKHERSSDETLMQWASATVHLPWKHCVRRSDGYKAQRFAQMR
jgi:hypothetical protein